ncbi:MAG: two pore domain potassium channel family protein, partial [Bacteroidetes bacterium]|nr:two pore domain potassium channel family protein [Bacteroidota bacterium]
TPTFSNSEIDDFEIDTVKVKPEPDFEKTYRTLAKAASESGNKTLAKDLKISELDFIRAKKTGFEKLLMTLNKAYWGYGQKPFQLIKISITVILILGLFYSFFPQDFSSYHAGSNECYLVTLLNSLYFSVVTFTTLGYGDLSPIGFLRFFAGLEALFGAITLGFLVAGLTKNS